MNDLEKKVLTNLNADPNNTQLLQKKSVSVDFFLYPEHKNLFKMITWYHQNYNQSLQSDSLQSLLQQSTTFSDDMKVRLGVLFEDIKNQPLVTNFELLLDELYQYYKFNLLSKSLSTAADKVGERKYDEAILSLKSDLIHIERVANPSSDTSGFLSEDAEGLIVEYFDRKEHPENYKGVMLGFPSIDSITGGLQKGTVTLVIGEMKSSKSVLMLNIARNVVSAGKRVYYHVNEGGKRLVYNRYIVNETGLNMTKVRDGNLSPEEELTYINYLKDQQAKNLNNFCVDSVTPARSKVSYVAAKLKELQTYGPIDLVVIDHMGLMSTDAKNIQADWQKFGAIALELKSLAMEYKVPIITVNHVNKEGMKSKGDDFQMEHMGLSLEPLKHVDMIMSWRIMNQEAFDIQHIGEGRLSIQGARDSSETACSLQINTNLMKIQEHIMSVAH